MSANSRWSMKIETSICATGYDGLILVSSGWPPAKDEPEPFKTVLHTASQIDTSLGSTVTVLPINLPARRLVYSPTGPLNVDYDDVRSFAEAGCRAVQRAVEAGVGCPLLIVLPDTRFENVELVTVLGALESLYVPLQVRQVAEHGPKVFKLGICSPVENNALQGIVELASVLESGRFVARDIGALTAPYQVEQYIQELFHGSRVTVQVVSNEETLSHEYPLLSAVNQASNEWRNRSRVLFVTYEPPNATAVVETVLFVGHGSTAIGTCVGLMQVVNLLQPASTKVVVALCLVHNNNYVADEIITGRSGCQVRLDVESFAMADVLFHVKEMALCSVNPHIIAVATICDNGHVGNAYTMALDNGVARSFGCAEKLRASAHAIGDVVEVSRLRREDFSVEMWKKIPSTAKSRGLAAFLMVASGIDEHGAASSFPLKYTFIGITHHLSEDHDRFRLYVGNTVVVLSYCHLIQGKCLTIRTDPTAQMQYAFGIDYKAAGVISDHPIGITEDSLKNPCSLYIQQSG